MQVAIYFNRTTTSNSSTIIVLHLFPHIAHSIPLGA
uniref:Uncharacterized protein n=1 Tax=Arundo donax TaxID=35708 RepID=A0A0A9FHS4_ARUDO